MTETAHVTAAPPRAELPTAYTPYASPPVGADAPAAWSTARLAAFRVAFAYFVLYNAPRPFSEIEGVGGLFGWYDRAWEALVPWVGAHVLRLAQPIVLKPSGSGDKLYDYVWNFTVLALAALAALVWSAVDRRRREHRALDRGLHVYLRYCLAFVMLGYGAFKVIKSQFPAPGLERLVQPYGSFSPMGVVWSWMGGSLAYNVFTGLGEWVGALLLFWRRTATLGAVLLVAVLSNVVMLNYAYDIPVKLFSTNLLLMAIYLALPHARRLADVLLFHRPTTPADVAPPALAPWPRRGRVALKAVLVALGVGMPLKMSWDQAHRFGDYAPRPSLYGIYDVERFVVNHDTVPALVTDTARWRRVIVGSAVGMSVQMMSDSVRRYSLALDTAKRTLGVTSRRDSTLKMSFAYAREGDDRLRVDGVRGADSLHLLLRRVDHTKFLLLSRGFHWVNEVPFNR